MPDDRAEHAFHEGVTAFDRGDAAGAADLFRRALGLARDRGTLRLQMRCLSWFSLATARAHGVTPVAVRACEAAAMRAPGPEMQWNLGRIYLIAGRRGDALAAFARGLGFDPADARLRAAHARADRRARPVIRRLPRGHLLNRVLGRMRRRRRSPSGPGGSPHS